MAIPLLAMALGGAALGALSNPEDRKKGALMGLGAGLLGPAMFGGAAAGGAAAGSGAAAGTAGLGAAAGTGAGAAGTAGLGSVGAGAAGTTGATLAPGVVNPALTSALNTAPQTMTAGGLNTTALQSSLAGSGQTMTASGLNTTALQNSLANTTGAGTGLTQKVVAGANKPTSLLQKGMTKGGKFLKEHSGQLVGAGLKMAMDPPKSQPPASTENMALKQVAQQTTNPYERAAINTQGRMKRKAQPRRFI